MYWLLDLVLLFVTNKGCLPWKENKEILHEKRQKLSYTTEKAETKLGICELGPQAQQKLSKSEI